MRSWFPAFDRTYEGLKLGGGARSQACEAPF